MADALFGPDPVISISYSNDKIIGDIMSLYGIDRFSLDCTYSKGVFWKNLPSPLFKSDLNPVREDIVCADSRDLPFDDGSMSSVMYDPPFVIYGDTKKITAKSKIADRFGGFKNFAELKSVYYESLVSIYRVLDDDGILVFKCQDIVSSGKNHFTHSMVMNMAVDIGYYPRDLFILLSKNRVNNSTKWKNQHHARKHHSYFWVFEKRKNRVDYNY